MAAAEKLSYEDRFGDEIRGTLVPENQLPHNSKAQSAASNVQNKGKHTDWFTDGKGYEDAPKTAVQPQSRLRKITPGMALKELASATLNNMSVMGEDNYNEIEKCMSRMVPRHGMKRSIKASILADKPHFGSCRIGKVPLKREVHGEVIVVTELQYYIANFNTVLSTAKGSSLHTPQGNEFGRTYFGVVVDINETTGKAMGFNKTYGREGVVFQTGNKKDAMIFMTAFSSGKKPQEVAEMMDRASQQVAEASAPRMRR